MSTLQTSITPSGARTALEPDVLFTPQLVIPHLNADNKIAAIKQLLDRMYQTGIIENSLAFLQAVLERENLESTIIGGNIALPHARSRSVQHLGLAVGLAHPPIDFPSGDERHPVELICLVAAPQHSSAAYLRLQAHLARILSDPGVRRELHQIGNAAEIHRLLMPELTEF